MKAVSGIFMSFVFDCVVVVAALKGSGNKQKYSQLTAAIYYSFVYSILLINWSS